MKIAEQIIMEQYRENNKILLDSFVLGVIRGILESGLTQEQTLNEVKSAVYLADRIRKIQLDVREISEKIGV